MSEPSSETIFSDQEEVLASKSRSSSSGHEGAFVELPPNRKDDDQFVGVAAKGDGRGPIAADEEAPDVAGLPVPDDVEYLPTRSGLFGGLAVGTPDKSAPDHSNDDAHASAFQASNLTNPRVSVTDHDDAAVTTSSTTAAEDQQDAEEQAVTEISQRHFDHEDGAAVDGAAGASSSSAGADDGLRDGASEEETFIKLQNPPPDGTDPLSSALSDDSDDGSADTISIPLPALSRTPSLRSDVGAASVRNDEPASDAGAAGVQEPEDDEDYSPNPSELFANTGTKVLVTPEAAPEKRGFGQMTLSDELGGSEFADGDEQPPAKHFGTPVQVESPPPDASVVARRSVGPVKRSSRSGGTPQMKKLDLGHSPTGTSSTVTPTHVDQKRSVDESSKPFSVKRSRPDSKPTMREDDDDDNDGSFEVLDGDKRCKTGNSPQRLETAAIPFDVIITLGGGLTSSGEPTPWVVARLRDGNLKFDSPDVYHLLLSRGTPHKVPPKDRFGFEIGESTAMSKYLNDNGIDAARILKDNWSLDTIGNAYFARCMVCEPRGFRRVLIVTSKFHMPRAESIFRHVFTVDALGKYQLEFLATPNEGLTGTPALKARQDKEAASLEAWESNKARLNTLADLSSFVLTEHNAYNTRGRLASLDGADPTGSPMKPAAADAVGNGGSKHLLDTY